MLSLFGGLAATLLNSNLGRSAVREFAKPKPWTALVGHAVILALCWIVPMSIQQRFPYELRNLMASLVRFCCYGVLFTSVLAAIYDRPTRRFHLLFLVGGLLYLFHFPFAFWYLGPNVYLNQLFGGSDAPKSACQYIYTLLFAYEFAVLTAFVGTSTRKLLV